ncbi:MAG: DUF2752 domain-containing protein [Saprospiraceae bacterium]|nr:DUF2752 domain-containing protein [Saprospiraceae bacterium]
MNFLGGDLFPCAYKQLFNIDCPICGFQRSFILLINGDFIKSFYTYAPLIPILIYLLVCVVYIISPSKFSKNLINNFGLGVLYIVGCNYIIKAFVYFLEK